MKAFCLTINSLICKFILQILLKKTMFCLINLKILSKNWVVYIKAKHQSASNINVLLTTHNKAGCCATFSIWTSSARLVFFTKWNRCSSFSSKWASKRSTICMTSSEQPVDWPLSVCCLRRASRTFLCLYASTRLKKFKRRVPFMSTLARKDSIKQKWPFLASFLDACTFIDLFTLREIGGFD